MRISAAFVPAIFATSLAAQTADTTHGTPRNPSYAADGRLAVSVGGHIWMRGLDGKWAQVTAGPSWDREPAWTTDGTAIVYSSDHSSRFSLWRVAVGPSGAAGEPERLTTSNENDGEPAPARDGRVFFVRGRLGAAKLWVRSPSGGESRVTNEADVEQWPTVTLPGDRLAWVSSSGTTRRIRVRSLEGSARDTTVLTDPRVEHPKWAPAGDRLTFTATGPRGGVYVVPGDGHYTNLVSARHAESAWSPDGKTLTLTDIPAAEFVAGYNGDPDRTGDREANLLSSASGGLWTMDAPAPADVGAVPAGTALPTTRAEFNADAFDQLSNRMIALYYSGPNTDDRRARWQAVTAKYRSQALAAKSDSDLKEVMHAMLRQHPPYRQSATGRAAVSSANPVSTAAGLSILEKGGSVVDAAVAVSFALGVVEPDASGPGGYGQMLIYKPGMARPQLIEFMTRVPEDAGLQNTSLLRNGRLPDDGPVLANVPGTVAEMYRAWKEFGGGKLPWSDLVQPAINAARDGYIVSEGLATTLATERDRFLKYDGSKALFFRGDQPLRAGDTLKNPDLAWTLGQIASGGADAFYKGEIAKRLVADLHGRGNAMKLTDMARYYAADRDPVSTTYRGYTIFSSAPPVSGGAELSAQLNMLELFPKPQAYQDDAATLNAMVSAWQLVPSSRNRISDPGLWPTTTEPFTNKDTARIRWRCYSPDKAINTALLRGDTLTCAQGETKAASVQLAQPPECEAHGYDANQTVSCRAAGTTAFVVADRDGNVVAVTQTLGTWGGSFYVTPGLGFIYNDKLGSYGTDSTAYGARLPFERHGSTIAPTIVFEGSGNKAHPVIALGAAGNAWITSAVYQTLVGMIDQHLDPQAALELPRFLLAGGGGGGRGRGAGPGGRGGGPNAAAPQGTAIQMEDGFDPRVIAQMERMGYRPQFISLMGELRMGYGAALKIENGRVTAGADPRRAGAAAAVP